MNRGLGINKRTFVAFICCLLICRVFLEFGVLICTNDSTKYFEVKNTTEVHQSIRNIETMTDRNVIETLNQFYYYKCPDVIHLDKISDIHICGNIRNTSYDLVLFTTMYYSASHMTFFMNTIQVIASLQIDYNIQGVIYIESTKSFINNNATKLIEMGCDLGIVVLLAPHCNYNNFPVFKSMFNVSMDIWDAQWYGYCNGDILLDESLIATMRFIQSLDRTLPVPMFAGRRYNTEVNV